MTRLERPFVRRRGVVHAGGVALTDVARRSGTPCYVTVGDRVRENVRRLQRAFAAHYPDFRIHYAVKANNNPALLALLRQEGTGVDCSTPSEIALARRAGFARGDVLYSGNYQSDAELEAGIRAQVAVNLDDDAMLPRLLRFGRPPVLSFRVNPGLGEGKYAGLVFGGAHSKFGIPAARARAGYAAALRAGVRRFGIHMMAGSCVLRPAFFAAAAERLLDVAGDIARTLGIRFEFVNLGGGFGVAYAPGERALDIFETARRTARAVRRKLAAHPIGAPRLLVEPGRYLVCDSTVLLCRVTCVKRRLSARQRDFVGTDAGMHTLLRPALYGAYHAIELVSRRPAGPVARVNVCGPICENTDLLARDRSLPRLVSGDLLAILNAGAYGFAMSSQYNTRPRCAEVLIVGGRAHEIRRAETVADLVRHVRVPAELARAI